MRHKLRGRKLTRDTSARAALLRTLAAQLIEHEQIITTVPKAKEIRPIVEKLITLGKRGDMHARRQAISFLGQGQQDNVKKLFDVLASRYNERQGGYTRIMRAGFRKGDSAPIGVIELVDRDVEARGRRDREYLEAVQAEEALANA